MVFELASICLSFYNNFYSSESLLYCKTNVAYCYVLYDSVEIVSPAELSQLLSSYYTMVQLKNFHPLYLHVFNCLVISYVNYWLQIIDFLSTVIDNRDVIAMLIQPLLKLGLVDRVIGLLTTELERSADEKLDRYVELT